MINRISRFILKVRTKFYCILHSNLHCQKGSTIDKYVEIDRSGRIEIGCNTSISKWVVFKNWGGYIKIGNNCTINSFSHLSGNGGIEIGNDVRIASHTTIISANHNFDKIDKPIFMQGETRELITIGDDCWIGSGARILTGVKIGKGSVIGAGSVVVKDVPEYSVVVGVPGRVIKSRK